MKPNSVNTPIFPIILLIFLIILSIVLFLIKNPWNLLILSVLSLIISIYVYFDKDTSGIGSNIIVSFIFGLISFIFFVVFLCYYRGKKK